MIPPLSQKARFSVSRWCVDQNQALAEDSIEALEQRVAANLIAHPRWRSSFGFDQLFGQ